MSPYAVQPTQILLVDDDRAVLEEVSAVLSSAGFVCHCCASAETALPKIRESLPDLIISDIHLGGETGWAMWQQIQDEVAVHDVPWMFLSGAQIPDIIRRSHPAGAAYCLRKPADPQVLLELVHKALHARDLAAANVAE